MKTKKKAPERVWIRYTECVESANVSLGCYEDLLPFIELLDRLSLTASKSTHYHKLDEWSKPVNEYVHDMLTKYGFVNGGAALGIPQPSDAEFWWNVYAMVNSVIYSPNLKSSTAHHHSSAWERNEAMLLDLVYVKDKVLYDQSQAR